MFKKCIVTLGVLMLIGCAGTGFNLNDNPVLNQMLLVCGDKPVAEFEECVQDEFNKAPNTEGMTVNEIIELLDAGLGTTVE